MLTMAVKSRFWVASMRKTLMANLLIAGCFAPLLVLSSIAQNKASVASKLDFKVTVMGELKDVDGVHLGFTTFTGSDGSKLTVVYGGFPSSEAAQGYLEKEIAKAAKLVDRKKRVSPDGKIVAERAEVLLRWDDEKTMPAILRSDGAEFHEFRSSSRESLLQLERFYMGEHE